jgi:hypothetical protein
MPSETTKLEPLMASIERMLTALETESVSPPLADAVQDLRGQFDAYMECCCRRAHVIPYYEDESA